ncbi:MAG: signal recognition particle-docking protein FtsY [Candidatus Magnetoglobus multicellularis str. Araruama]|uniref:Signal recognition particle receptor FtsY n=1 Tax=Candidatus Magnetoglobus multicellularis str. Araruama TaxID=890399 RepID=A0A1V1P1Z3_9BACT|nr:MAG: signal recognition particle-docking protein FtsY [Candidatus Magnetoglobus multicellularis str. Araruama]
MGIWRKKRLDDELIESLEESLITADIGVETTMTIMESLEEQIQKKKITTTDQLQSAVLNELMQRLPQSNEPEDSFIYRPHVILVVGVNGVGKTTTIGKLASRLNAQGKKVIIGASDTFRAAAVEQLEQWAQRASSDIVRHNENADPAAVAFDTVQAAISRKADIAIIDTAGRLHTKKNLMEEIRKIRRSIAKKMPDAPHDIFLILDATTGQNAVSQTRLFHEALNVTGIILTKLDGTAKGGIVVSIANTFDIPIRYIGLGESIEDLQPFDSELFIRALIET